MPKLRHNHVCQALTNGVKLEWDKRTIVESDIFVFLKGAIIDGRITSFWVICSAKITQTIVNGLKVVRGRELRLAQLLTDKKQNDSDILQLCRPKITHDSIWYDTRQTNAGLVHEILIHQIHFSGVRVRVRLSTLHLVIFSLFLG